MDSVEELRDAIYRYKHLLRGGDLDYDTALKIEEIEINIKNEIKNNKIIYENLKKLSLNDFIMNYKEYIYNLILKYSNNTGENVSDPEKALEAFLVGDTAVEGFRTAFIVVQAVARLKAEIFEKIRGVIENSSPVCPVCGAVSRTMIKGEDESYSMVCPFCGYMWKVSRGRLVCPFCGNSDPLSVGYFTGKKSRRLGLAWCQKCGAVWRIILDPSIRAPRLLLPVIAHGAEIYRALISGSREDSVDNALLKPGEGGAEE